MSFVGGSREGKGKVNRCVFRNFDLSFRSRYFVIFIFDRYIFLVSFRIFVFGF